MAKSRTAGARKQSKGILTAHPRTPVVGAPLAVLSDGCILVNANQFSTQDTLGAVLARAVAMGLPLFIGVLVPARLKGRFVRELEDAAADVVGRLGPKVATYAKRSR